jgi:membrane-bound lytic murein transglycosylase D
MKRLCCLILLLCLCSPLKVSAADALYYIKESAKTRGLYNRAIEFITHKFPEAFEKRLVDSTEYIDLITNVFKDRGIPRDIAYLPLIESGFRPLAISNASAVGLWQFMKGTAIKYGLRIDGYVDERKDPVMSTYAAADYLSDLYIKFGSWDLALAAYNAGESRIHNMLKTNDNKRLPRNVYGYLAKFAAASAIAQDPEEFGLTAPAGGRTTFVGYIEIKTNSIVSLRSIAKHYGTTVAALKRLNPALKNGATPPYPYTIRLPG